MYKGKARAYTNIALIKYWGKENETLILPMNNSLSLTLDAFYTETSVTFSEEYTQDRFSWMTNSRVRLQRRKSPLFGSCTRKSQLSFSRKSTAAISFQQLLVLLHLLVD